MRAPKVRTEAWSEQKKRKENRDIRREKKERKREWLRKQAENDKSQDEQADDDASDGDDWAAEERAAKRVRQGKLTESDFETGFFSGL